MRILVTGASGFAGAHLLAALSRTGAHEITAGTFGDLSDVPAFARHLASRWISLDITSDESVRSAIRATRPEQVYHLAGQASVGESFRAPQETWDVNATGTLRLLEALRQEELEAARVLLISSAEVYGAVREAEQPIVEEHPLRPITPYGVSKAAAELLGVQCALTGSAEVVISRSFNHIGPGQDLRFVLPSFARQLVRIRRGLEPPELMVGNLDVSRDFLDVRDAVRGYVVLMERGESGMAYNVCSGETRSLNTVVGRLVELSGADARIVVDTDRFRPVDIPELRGSPERLEALGWEREVPLDQTLTDLLHEVESRSVPGG